MLKLFSLFSLLETSKQALLQRGLSNNITFLPEQVVTNLPVPNNPADIDMPEIRFASVSKAADEFKIAAEQAITTGEFKLTLPEQITYSNVSELFRSLREHVRSYGPIISTLTLQSEYGFSPRAIRQFVSCFKNSEHQLSSVAISTGRIEGTDQRMLDLAISLLASGKLQKLNFKGGGAKVIFDREKKELTMYGDKTDDKILKLTAETATQLSSCLPTIKTFLVRGIRIGEGVRILTEAFSPTLATLSFVNCAVREKQITILAGVISRLTSLQGLILNRNGIGPEIKQIFEKLQNKNMNILSFGDNPDIGFAALNALFKVMLERNIIANILDIEGCGAAFKGDKVKQDLVYSQKQ